jgi:hypothetical protein
MEYKILRVNTEMSQFHYLKSPAAVKLSQVFMQSARHSCPILTEFEISRKTFMKVPNIKFHGNSSSRSQADTRGQTDEAPHTIFVEGRIYEDLQSVAKIKSN